MLGMSVSGGLLLQRWKRLRVESHILGGGLVEAGGGDGCRSSRIFSSRPLGSRSCEPTCRDSASWGSTLAALNGVLSPLAVLSPSGVMPDASMKATIESDVPRRPHG
jgi:hypothetical protein